MSATTTLPAAPWQAWAAIPVPPSADLVAIATAAGGAIGQDTLKYDGGILYVQGVSTGALEAALAAYDPEAGLPDLKASLKREVDASAEQLRLTMITPGDGQAMEYAETQRQAEGALAATDAEATPAAFPMLAASIGIDVDPGTGEPAADVKGVARAVLAARDLWIVVGSQIRAARLGAKAAIDAASSTDEAYAAAAAIAWPGEATTASA